jgi:acyl-CoA thioester hydrolase
VPRTHSHEIRVRYGECDAQGIVFNAHYLAFFDIALTELWRASFGSYAAMVEQGIDVVVAEAVVRFRRPARFDDMLELTIEVTRLGTTSMATTHRVTRDGELLVEGEMVHVFVETAGYTKTAIPPALRAELEAPPGAV